MAAQDMTRRDWFRLGRPRSDAEPRSSHTPPLVGDVSPALQPIAQPVNHDGMNLSELPPMREALLSAEQVGQLFGDIERCATNVLLMQRSPRAQRAAATRATTSEQLHTARDSLVSGQIPRVQVRYRWQDADWIDTLQNGTEGFRLVRIMHQRPATAPQHGGGSTPQPAAPAARATATDDPTAADRE